MEKVIEGDDRCSTELGKKEDIRGVIRRQRKVSDEERGLGLRYPVLGIQRATSVPRTESCSERHSLYLYATLQSCCGQMNNYLSSNTATQPQP